MGRGRRAAAAAAAAGKKIADTTGDEANTDVTGHNAAAGGEKPRAKRSKSKADDAHCLGAGGKWKGDDGKTAEGTPTSRGGTSKNDDGARTTGPRVFKSRRSELADPTKLLSGARGVGRGISTPAEVAKTIVDDNGDPAQPQLVQQQLVQLEQQAQLQLVQQQIVHLEQQLGNRVNSGSAAAPVAPAMRGPYTPIVHLPPPPPYATMRRPPYAPAAEPATSAGGASNHSGERPSKPAGVPMQENSGRWSKEEHEAFLEGLRMYGRGAWQKVAAHVKTRTSKQVKTHAVKYFEKLQRAAERGVSEADRHVDPGDILDNPEDSCGGDETEKEPATSAGGVSNHSGERPSTPAGVPMQENSGRWSKEEHEAFLEGLRMYGRGAWQKVAAHVKTRTSKQVNSHAQSHFLKLQHAAERGVSEADRHVDPGDILDDPEDSGGGDETEKESREEVSSEYPSDASSACDEEGNPVNNYERKRKRNIRRNEKRLRRLGLLGNTADRSPPVEDDESEEEGPRWKEGTRVLVNFPEGPNPGKYVATVQKTSYGDEDVEVLVGGDEGDICNVEHGQVEEFIDDDGKVDDGNAESQDCDHDSDVTEGGLSGESSDEELDTVENKDMRKDEPRRQTADGNAMKRRAAKDETLVEIDVDRSQSTSAATAPAPAAVAAAAAPSQPSDSGASKPAAAVAGGVVALSNSAAKPTRRMQAPSGLVRVPKEDVPGIIGKILDTATADSLFVLYGTPKENALKMIRTHSSGEGRRQLEAKIEKAKRPIDPHSSISISVLFGMKRTTAHTWQKKVLSGEYPKRATAERPSKPAGEPTQENSGRWSKEEHEAFLAGMRMYGKEDWQKVAAHVKTRTKTQTRTHAEKYFEKLQKLKDAEKRLLVDGEGEEARGCLWTEQEIDLLEKGIQRYGWGNFDQFEELLRTRDLNAIKQRAVYYRKQKPHAVMKLEAAFFNRVRNIPRDERIMNMGYWTDYEDVQFQRLVVKCGWPSTASIGVSSTSHTGVCPIAGSDIAREKLPLRTATQIRRRAKHVKTKFPEQYASLMEKYRAKNGIMGTFAPEVSASLTGTGQGEEGQGTAGTDGEGAHDVSVTKEMRWYEKEFPSAGDAGAHDMDDAEEFIGGSGDDPFATEECAVDTEEKGNSEMLPATESDATHLGGGKRYDAVRLAKALRKKGTPSGSSQFDWVGLGYQVGLCFNAVPSNISFLYGPLGDSTKKRKRKTAKEDGKSGQKKRVAAGGKGGKRKQTEAKTATLGTASKRQRKSSSNPASGETATPARTDNMREANGNVTGTEKLPASNSNNAIAVEVTPARTANTSSFSSNDSEVEESPASSANNEGAFTDTSNVEFGGDGNDDIFAMENNEETPAAFFTAPDDVGDEGRTFPFELHDMLERAASEDGVVSWIDDGRAFVIRDQDAFTRELLPLFFGQTHFSSFTRLLNRWGFKSIQGAWVHAHFIRGDVAGLRRIEQIQKIMTPAAVAPAVAAPAPPSAPASPSPETLDGAGTGGGDGKGVVEEGVTNNGQKKASADLNDFADAADTEGSGGGKMCPKRQPDVPDDGPTDSGALAGNATQPFAMGACIKLSTLAGAGNSALGAFCGIANRVHSSIGQIFTSFATRLAPARGEKGWILCQPKSGDMFYYNKLINDKLMLNEMPPGYGNALFHFLHSEGCKTVLLANVPGIKLSNLRFMLEKKYPQMDPFQFILGSGATRVDLSRDEEARCAVEDPIAGIKGNGSLGCPYVMHILTKGSDL